MPHIDLNADLGEGAGSDEALLDLVSSASIACGGHAGDAQTIRTAIEACQARGVRIGAHPGFVDRENFGRVRMDLPPLQLAEQIQAQMLLFYAVAFQTGADVAYFKPHGALANMSAEDPELADLVVGAAQAIDPEIAILALDRSCQVDAAEAVGMDVIREAYADRAYTPAGLLVPRSAPGAVLHDTEEVVERCLRLALHGEIVAIDGTILRSEARSICLHGDTPGAVELARAVRAGLDAAGIAISASQP